MEPRRNPRLSEKSATLVYAFEYNCTTPPLQEAFSRQLDFACCLAVLEAALGSTELLAFAKLKLFFVGVPSAWAVVREVNAGESVGAEIFVTRSY